MDIDIEQQAAGLHVVRFSGELSGHDNQTIQKSLHPLIAPRDTAMIVDLAQLTAIDSGGLSQLISLTTHARLSHSRVILVGPTPFVAGILKMTKLDGWFDMADDIADAKRRLDHPA